MTRKQSYFVLLFLAVVLIPLSGQGGQIRFKSSDEIPASSIGIAETYASFFGSSPVGDDIIKKLNLVGVKWVRLFLTWNQTEIDTSRTYRFRNYKSNCAKFTAAGIAVYLCPEASNDSYNPLDSGKIVIPHDTRTYAAWLAFLKAASDTLKPWVHDWELTNEPNIYASWKDTTTVEQDYLTISRAAADTIRSRDPQAVFSLGGLSLIDIPFLRTCLLGGAGNYVTKVGFHPYRPWPEIGQDTIPWLPNHRFTSPYTSYEQELQALKDTVARYASGLELWDTEGCYLSDSLGWNPVWFNLRASEATQAKYLARRYLLNLAHSIPLTTWTTAWDFLSLIGNQAHKNWVNDYRKRQDYPFVDAPFMGLMYTPQDSLSTYSREAENHSRITPPMADTTDPLAQGGRCIWTPDGLRQPNGRADYDSLALQGLYLIWSRVRGSGDTIGLFVTQLDSLPVTLMFNATLPPDTFRWEVSPNLTDSSSLQFFRLGPGLHNLMVLALDSVWDGSRLDAFKFVYVDTNAARKQAFTALQGIATLFDSKVVPAPLVWDTTNISVPDSAWSKFHLYTFQDTSTSATLVPYWLALIAQDAYPANQRFTLTLTLDTSRIRQPVLVNLLDGSFVAQSYRWAGGVATFDSLPAGDFPYCLIPDSRFLEGVARLPNENLPGPFALELCPAVPNPAKEGAQIRFILPRKGAVRLVLYNILGQEVQTLFQGDAAPGEHLVQWNGTRAGPGVYFYRLEFEGQTRTRPLVHLN